MTLGNVRYKTLPTALISREYMSGDSIITIAKRHKAGYGTIRRILVAAGTPMRKVGQRGLNAETRLIEATTVASAASTFWYEPPGEHLHPQEVAKLRRAVGWDESWVGPYDAINGD